MKIVSLIEHNGTFLTFITTDEGDAAPESSTIFLGMRPGERLPMQKQADALALAVGGSLCIPPEDRALDFEPVSEMEDDLPPGVDLWMTLARQLGKAGQS